MSRLLSSIRSPRDLRQLPVERLPALAAEVRAHIARGFSLRGDYLRSALGITDLTCALHYGFDFSHDRLVFDLAHQCAAHLVLTRGAETEDAGDEPRLTAPFPGDERAPYDHFFAAHAGTSISKALGMAAGRASPGKTVAVIGDGAVSTGIALEALNSGDFLDQDVLVVLNDNQMSISKVVGAMGEYLSKLRVGKSYNELKRDAHKLIQAVPFVGESLERAAEQLRDVVARALVPGYTFEKLGPRYFGPVDGHNIAHLVRLLAEIRRQKGFYLLHVVTRREAEPEPRVATWMTAARGAVDRVEEEGAPTWRAELEYEAQGERSWSDELADGLLEVAAADPAVSVVVMARPEFEDLGRLRAAARAALGDRLYDIGVSEQHGLAFSAGLASEGRRPIVVVPAAFLGRGVDQVLHDVVQRRLPVTLALVHAGLVDDDVAILHGAHDVAQLRAMPEIDVMAPRDGVELRSMLQLAAQREGPSALRIPRGFAPGAGRLVPVKAELARGRGEWLRRGTDVAIVAYGAMAHPALEAAEKLATKGLEASVVNARFARPLDVALLTQALKEHALVFTLEDHGRAGGFGSAALEAASAAALGTDRMRVLALPDERLPRGSRVRLLRALGLDPAGVADRVLLDYRRWVRGRDPA